MAKKIDKYEKFNGKYMPKIDDLELFAKLAEIDVELIRCQGPYTRLSNCGIEASCDHIDCVNCLLHNNCGAGDLVSWCRDHDIEVTDSTSAPLFEGKAVPGVFTDLPRVARTILRPEEEGQPITFFISCSGVQCPKKKNSGCGECILEGGTLRKLNRAKRWYEQNRKQLADKYFEVKNTIFRKMLSTIPESAKSDPLLLSHWLQEAIDPEDDLDTLIAVVAQTLAGK